MIRSLLEIPEDKLNSLKLDNQVTAYDRNVLHDLMQILSI